MANAHGHCICRLVWRCQKHNAVMVHAFSFGWHNRPPTKCVLLLQVLRVLTTIMSDFGSVPIAKRSPPSTLGPEAAKHLQPLAQQAVVALQV